MVPRLALFGSLAVLALAAASPALAQAPAPAGLRWTGLYAGMNIGGAWAGSVLSNTGTDTSIGGLGSILRAGATPSSIDFRSSGLTGGAQVGYNVQLGALVIGAEADIHWFGRSQSFTATPVVPGFVPVTTTANQSLERLYTLRAKAGVALGPQILLYGTGGFAFGDGSTTIQISAPAAGPPLAVSSRTDLKSGWTAGLGIEVALTDRVSFKAEYLHYDLGSQASTVQYNYGLNRSTLTSTWRDDGDIAQVGINYRF